MGRVGGAGGGCLGAPRKPWLHPQARGVPPFLLRCSRRKARAARAIAEGEAFWGGAAGAEPLPVGSCDGAGCAPSSSSSSSSFPPGGSDPAAPCPQEPCVAALARVERTDFLSPMCIGEVANVSAEITYTSKHSVEVQVNVMSENILTGAKKVTNKATLWYVPLALKNVNKVVEVPPIQYARKEQEDEGRKRYEEQKLDRLETKQRNGDVIMPVINPDRQTKEPHTVGYSQSSLIHLVGPSDCTLLGFVHGGVTMKLMDEVAGIVAARHCKTNIVTASVDAINFHEKIKKGSVITISGRMTFTSNKSMEIEVFVDADPFVDEPQERYRAVSAFFTYVSLSKEGKPLPVPQLLTETEDEKRRFEEGKGRYLQTKAKRQAQMQQAAQH
uniref:Acyl-CoA thioesterase 7 n=1 Tax=Anas platyrhynchos platyrhynchos TaxID=8840 RepID=A0A493TEC4_ANAPP